MAKALDNLGITNSCRASSIHISLTLFEGHNTSSDFSKNSGNMAAQEYYLGTKAAHELAGNYPPRPPQYQQPPQQPYPHGHSNVTAYANTPPPTYSTNPQPPHQPNGYPFQQQHPERSSQAMTAPYPQTPPAGHYPPQHHMMPQPQNNNYLGVPMQPIRSHSQPARVRFANYDSDASTSLGSISDSDEASPPRRHRPTRHQSYTRPERAYSPDYHDRSHNYRDDDKCRYRRHKHHDKEKDKAHDSSHKNRDTFLGAGAGTIIGDAIFPGLGTAAGLVLGGYGGRKYARERSRSDVSGREREKERRAHGGSRRAGDDGWDEKTRTFRKGAAVR